MRGLFGIFILSASFAFLVEANCNLATLKIPLGSPEPSASYAGPLIDRIYGLFRKQNRELEIANLSVLGSLIAVKDPAFLSWLQKESQVMTDLRIRNHGVFNPDLELRFSFYKNLLTRIEKKKKPLEQTVSEAGMAVLNALASQLSIEDIQNRDYFNPENKALPDEWSLVVKALQGNEVFIKHMQEIILDDKSRKQGAKVPQIPIEQQRMLRAVLYFVNRKIPDQAFNVDVAHQEAREYLIDDASVRKGFSDHAEVLGRKYYKNLFFIEWAEEKARHYRALMLALLTRKDEPEEKLIEKYQYNLIAQYYTEMAEVATNYEPSTLPPP